MSHLRCLALACLLLALTPARWAAGDPPQPVEPPPPREEAAPPRAIASPEAQAVAQETLRKLKADLPRLRARLWGEFEKSAAWRQALARYQAAVKNHQRARVNVLSRLRDRQDYKEAAAEYAEAVRRHEAADSPRATPDRSGLTLQRLTAARAVLSRLEAAAMKGDLAVKVAHGELQQSQRLLAALRKQFEQDYPSDPAWKKHQAAIDLATEELALARRQQRADQALERMELALAQHEEWERMRDERLLRMEQDRLLWDWYRGWYPTPYGGALLPCPPVWSAPPPPVVVLDPAAAPGPLCPSPYVVESDRAGRAPPQVRPGIGEVR